MEEHDLYDLAATPRFMIALIQAASAGREIRSRSRVLQHLLDDAIGAAVEEAQGVTGSEQISRHGIRVDVREALNALAWAMQSQQVEALPLDQAFAIARRVRGDREYGLEGLHSALAEPPTAGFGRRQCRALRTSRLAILLLRLRHLRAARPRQTVG